MITNRKTHSLRFQSFRLDQSLFICYFLFLIFFFWLLLSGFFSFCFSLFVCVFFAPFLLKLFQHFLGYLCVGLFSPEGVINNLHVRTLFSQRSLINQHKTYKNQCKSVSCSMLSTFNILKREQVHTVQWHKANIAVKKKQ